MQIEQITNTTVQPSPTPKPTVTDAVVSNFSGVLIILAFVIIVSIQMLMALKKNWTNNSIKIVGISTIAFVSVFAALTVQEKNAAAVFGLLGTIAGYLLGKAEDSVRERDSNSNVSSPLSSEVTIESKTKTPNT